MKKLAIIFAAVAVATVGGFVFLKPHLASAYPGKPGAGDSKNTPAQFAQQLLGKVKSALGNVALAKTPKPGTPQRNPSVKIINESTAGVPPKDDGASTNTVVQHDPKVQAGLKAMHQLAVRGIVVSGNRSSAIIQTGRQTQPVFVGDTLNIKTPEGLVMLRCEKIDRRTVWIRIPQTPVLAELSLP